MMRSPDRKNPEPLRCPIHDSPMLYREAQLSDVPGMARLRAHDWASAEYWQERMQAYLTGQLHPRQALASRVGFVCIDGDEVVGLIAGHLTRRFGCDGELEWISVSPAYRGQKIASGLLRLLAEWFIAEDARFICVDVDPANEPARKFYAANGAYDLKPHWMAWKDIRTVCQTTKA
jgi:ribosomal protein S18 acetylase RimI-like enzyme